MRNVIVGDDGRLWLVGWELAGFVLPSLVRTRGYDDIIATFSHQQGRSALGCNYPVRVRVVVSSRSVAQENEPPRSELSPLSSVSASVPCR